MHQVLLSFLACRSDHSLPKAPSPKLAPTKPCPGRASPHPNTTSVPVLLHHKRPAQPHVSLPPSGAAAPAPLRPQLKETRQCWFEHRRRRRKQHHHYCRRRPRHSRCNSDFTPSVVPWRRRTLPLFPRPAINPPAMAASTLPQTATPPPRVTGPAPAGEVIAVPSPSPAKKTSLPLVPSPPAP